ncbi:MAG: 30S ribosomal protein S11 [bacterium]
MGKKRIIKTDQEALLKERDKIEEASQKGIKAEPRRVLGEGKIYIASSYNNTIMTLTDVQGNVLSWVTAGRLGFKGSKKSTPFAASRVAEILSDTAKKMGIGKIKVFVKGVGGGRESALRALIARGLEVTAIKDITPVPHNGCRPRKVRRM